MPPHSGVRAESSAARAAAAGTRARRARAGGRGGAAARAGDRCRRGSRREARDAPRGGARDVPVARPRRSRPGSGRAGVGGRPTAPRGHRLRGRAGRAGRRRLRDEGCRAALRRRAAGARACARGRRLDLGSAHRRSRPALHRPRCRERRASGSDPHGRGEGRRGVPRAAAALAAADDAESLRGARGSRTALARGAARGFPPVRSRSGWGWTGERRGGSPSGGRKATRARPQARLGAGRGARLPRSNRERAHAATGARLTPRAPARASRTGRAAVSKTRAGRPARRWGLVAAGDDAA